MSPLSVLSANESSMREWLKYVFEVVMYFDLLYMIGIYLLLSILIIAANSPTHLLLSGNNFVVPCEKERSFF